MCVLWLAAVGISFAQDDDRPLPDVITVENAGVLPEGIVWDEVGERFIHGSLSQGTIYAVEDDGSTTPLIENEDFISTVGLHIDTATNRLLIAHSDSTIFQGESPTEHTAALYAYDLETNELLFFSDFTNLYLDPIHFANDVTVDDEGNAYVTDSMAPIIFRIDTEGNAEIFIEDMRLYAPIVGLNGIEYHPDGYLLAVVTTAGRLYKIPLDDPSAISQVETSEPIFGDGMTWFGEDLAVVSLNTVKILHSDDDWETATVIAQSSNDLEGATTVTTREDALYAVLANIADPDAPTFDIVRVELAETNH